MNASSIKRVFKIASVYIGTVLGAGFASGQELMQFFGRFGYKGILGLLVTGILFMLISWAVLDLVGEKGIKDYRGLLSYLCGSKIGFIMEVIVALFMFSCFSIMLAGTGALLQQRFEWSYYSGIVLMGFICFLTFLFDVKGLVVMNTLLVPILFVGAFLLGIHIIFFKDTEVFALGIASSFHQPWLMSAILYVSYNAITSVVVLATLGYLVRSPKVAKWAGIAGGGTLMLLGLCLGVATLLNYGKMSNVEIPMLEIIMDYNPLIQYGYIFILIAAMYTTAISNGYGFITRIYSPRAGSPILFRIVSMVVILAGCLYAMMGFSEMISKIYPLFGYLGLFQIILILIYFLMKNKTGEYRWRKNIN